MSGPFAAPRSIVQIAPLSNAYGGAGSYVEVLYVLCSDSTIWRIQTSGTPDKLWEQIPSNIPVSAEPAMVDVAQGPRINP